MREHDAAGVTDEEHDAEAFAEAVYADPWFSRLVLAAGPEGQLAVARQHGRIYRQGVDLCASIMVGAVAYLLIRSFSELDPFGLFSRSRAGWRVSCCCS